ncbi:ankyrin repeat and SOCS box protein 6-like [Periophthalmus magnuspinnatus]|uniref:ankyrin repeat and SOCS box protein 6-like n=1 Tax=Periophthalmus magnuspinnatus TaxID=409849 RepID=UPI002436B0A2|nr:ankyrin repeat and SOCS box protein 6-like [Periophthalmus magnuspinnatus]
MLACLSGKLDCVKTLLELGANVDERDYMGKTALFLVMEKQSAKECLQFLPPLLQKGSDPNTRSMHEESVEDCLCDNIRNRFVLTEEEEEDSEDAGFFWDKQRRFDLVAFVEMVSLLLRSGLVLRCCVENTASGSLLKLSLEHFPSLLPLSVLLLHSGAPFCPQDHDCWSRNEEERKR